ncbi:glycoside hydrolase family 48 protein [Ideonella sp. DXS29W]|uniref:Glycoside hydrolase family 48 protein n=1 Tax=Ideonella lacteola TaxID=2984193 RepID=A0ABU9BVR5_9BURK
MNNSPRALSRITQAVATALVAMAAGQALAVDVQATAFEKRFATQYKKIKDPANGYFSQEGIPYHSPETLIVEAPDYGHETTSEAYSFWIWLEAYHGRYTGDWGPLKKAWANMEKYMIPSVSDQPTNSFYNAAKPASYAGEYPLPKDYPAPLDFSAPVGQDPIAAELETAYGTRNIYGMHWLMDVDNWYGYGKCGDGVTRAAFINTFQRGAQESVWETVPHPSCDTFRWGRNGGSQGFLSLFTGDANYSKQWRYTNAPDADARAVEAMYWANIWAKEQGKAAEIADIVKSASKMGDYLRYSMFDKYFKKIGNCVGGPYSCQAGTGQTGGNGLRDNQHYLLSWYYSWGGATDTNAGWAWRIGSSHNHFGYQNPMAAWVLSTQADFKPKSPSGAGDWGKSLTRQIEFYRWLQSAEGGIAGGATNSWGGSYATPPNGTPTFYGMFYEEAPVYHDPESNTWFGFQAWSMFRVAEYYYATGDAKAKAVLDKWIPWASANVKFKDNGNYTIPSTLEWTGQPDTWNPNSPGANASLHVKVTKSNADVGITAALARTLIYYGVKANDAASKTLAKKLLDAMWTNAKDDMGLSVAEKRDDYLRFDDAYDAGTGTGVYIPSGWVGTNAQGATIDSNTTFLSMRPKYKQDPDWPKLQAYLNGGKSPKWRYHRFWAQADAAMAMLDYARLIETP